MHPWINDFFTPLNDGIARGMILVGLETGDTGGGGGGLATAGDMASLASKEPSGDPVGRGLRQPGKIGKTS